MTLKAHAHQHPTSPSFARRHGVRRKAVAVPQLRRVFHPGEETRETTPVAAPFEPQQLDAIFPLALSQAIYLSTGEAPIFAAAVDEEDDLDEEDEDEDDELDDDDEEDLEDEDDDELEDDDDEDEDDELEDEDEDDEDLVDEDDDLDGSDNDDEEEE